MADPSAALVAALKPLLHALDVLGVVARHFDPAEYDAVMDAVGAPDAELREALPGLAHLPPELETLRAAIAASATEAIAAFDGLRAALDSEDGVRAVFRALRHIPRARAALYPAATLLAPVSRFFLEPGRRDSTALLAALANPRPNTGVHHVGNEPGSRGGYSLYVPEYASPERAMPLVVALHGGSGNGRDFLWTWQRAARSHGAILVTPTATGSTWALMGEDTDTPNLLRILADISGQWRIDPTRMLLTGMSDGGTFTYVTGLESASPFTHPRANGRAIPPARPAHHHRPRRARLDVRRRNRPPRPGGPGRSRRPGDLPGIRGPQPHLPRRIERRVAGVALRALMAPDFGVKAKSKHVLLVNKKNQKNFFSAPCRWRTTCG